MSLGDKNPRRVGELDSHVDSHLLGSKIRCESLATSLSGEEQHKLKRCSRDLNLRSRSTPAFGPETLTPA